MPELFYSLRSPFARRVRVALQRLSLPYRAIESSAFEPTSEFLKANPLGLLPVYRVEDDEGWISIPDSTAILEYLHEAHGERLWPRDRLIRAEVRSASVLAQGLMQFTVNLYLESLRETPDASWIQDWRDSLGRTLKAISERPFSGLPWTLGSELTQAGYDLVVALEYMELRLPDFDFRHVRPVLGDFLDRERHHPHLVGTVPPPI